MSIRVLEFESLEKGVRVVMERAQRGEVKVCAVTAERLCTMEHWPLSALVYNAIANRALRKVCRIGFEVGLSSRKGLWYSMVLSDFVLLRQPGSSEYPGRVPLFYAVVTEVVSFDTSIG